MCFKTISLNRKPSNKLANLILNHQWDSVKKHCIKRPLDVQLESPCPLDLALERCAPLYVIEGLLNAYPDALYHVDSRGRTIFHKAIMNPNTLELLKVLLESTEKKPSSDKLFDLISRPTDKSKCTVLHNACKHNAPLDAIHFLLDHIYDSLKESKLWLAQNNEGATPAHLLARYHPSRFDLFQFIAEYKFGNIALESMDNEGDTILHKLCRGSKSLSNDLRSSFEFILKSFPCLLIYQNRKGQTPLHVACKTNAPYILVKLLVTADSSALSIGDKTGCTPYLLNNGFGTDHDVNELLEMKTHLLQRTPSLTYLQRDRSRSAIYRRRLTS